MLLLADLFAPVARKAREEASFWATPIDRQRVFGVGLDAVTAMAMHVAGRDFPRTQQKNRRKKNGRRSFDRRPPELPRLRNYQITTC
ncbi:hypothetical protein [Xanthomonas arboricola]|uniref:hypothetical protein n=1 Tax=Xanthomonas arboricola TaxID=56448 RepID=UPI003EB8EBFC